MDHIKLLLEPSSLTQLLTSQETIMVYGREDPTNTFQPQMSGYLVYIIFEWVNCQLEWSHRTSLGRFVDGLYDCTNSSLIVFIFSIVPIEKPYPLLSFTFACPVLDEIWNFRYIDELHIVNMSVYLPLQHHPWREASNTHSLWPWSMVFTVLFHPIRKGNWRQAVIAFGLRWVAALTF